MVSKDPGNRGGLDFVHDGHDLHIVYGEEGGAQALAERHPGWPKIHLTLDFAPHVTADDFAHVPEQLAMNHVLLVEGGGQDARERADAYQSIADRNPKEDPPGLFEDYLVKNGYIGRVDEPIMRGLYGSHKVVGCVDLIADQLPLGQEIARASNVRPDYNKGGYTAVRDDAVKRWLDVGRLQRQREEMNEARFEEEIGRLLDEHPELADLEELNVLWTMGLFHSDSLYDSMRRDESIEVTRRMPEETEFDYRHEAMRMGLSGAEDIPDDLKDKVYLETAIYSMVQREFISQVPPRSDGTPVLVSSLDKQTYMRNLVSQFSSSDIRMIFLNARMDRFGIGKLNMALAQKGLEPVPTTPHALHERAEQIRNERSSDAWV